VGLLNPTAFLACELIGLAPYIPRYASVFIVFTVIPS
jgi:hypothetical protein